MGNNAITQHYYEGEKRRLKKTAADYEQSFADLRFKAELDISKLPLTKRIAVKLKR